MICKREIFLSLNILSFLHSHSDQIMATAPTLRIIMYLWSTPCSQFPKILATLLDGYKFEATWMTDHIERAKLHWKNKYLIVSFWWQKTHFVLPCQFHLTRLSLVRITPWWRYQANILIFRGIFIFQILLLWSTGMTGWTSALYIEPTENLPFPCRFQRNSSRPHVK